MAFVPSTAPPGAAALTGALTPLLGVFAAAGNVVNQVSSFFPRTYIGDIPIQVTIEELHTHSMEITEHPIQKGADITDHAYKKPIQLELKCGWSNSSLEGISGTVTNTITKVAANGLASGLTSLLTQSSSLSSSTAGASDYVNSVFGRLIDLQEARQPFSILTPMRKYDDMLIQDISVTRDKDTSQSLFVSATLRQVILVDTQIQSLADASILASPEDNLGQVSLGTQSPEPITVPLAGSWVSPFA